MIITGPNEFVAQVHDRMPVLLADRDFEPWLSGSAGLELLKPAPDDLLQSWPVSKRVNSSRASDDDATLIAHANAVLADDRLRSQGKALFPLGALSGVPYDAIRRSSDARPPSLCGADQPHSGAVVPILPPARAVCRTHLPRRQKRRRRTVRRTHPPGVGRMTRDSDLYPQRPRSGLTGAAAFRGNSAARSARWRGSS